MKICRLVLWFENNRIKLSIRQKCGHYVTVSFKLSFRCLRKYFFLRKRLCYECWKVNQKVIKVRITEKLGLLPLRGSRAQFAYGMYRRAEFALELRKEGFLWWAIAPFLNSETQAGYWIKGHEDLKRLYLQFLVEQGINRAGASSVNIIMCARLIIAKYNYFINMLTSCIMSPVSSQSVENRRKNG